MKGLNKFLLTRGIFALYQFLIYFIFIFCIIRSYQFIYGPIPIGNQYYNEHLSRWNDSYKTLFTILMVFEYIFGSISLIVVAQCRLELPASTNTHVDVKGKRYEISKTGAYYSISPGTDNSGLSELIIRTLLGLIFVPINIISFLIRLFLCLIFKNQRDSYSNLDVSDYWLKDMLHLDEKPPLNVFLSQSFIAMEFILGIVIIVLSFTLKCYY